MPKFNAALHAWKSDHFSDVLKEEIAHLESGVLPLAQGVTQGGYIDDSNMAISIIHCAENDQFIHVKAGFFFTEIVVCCGCGDEPMHQNAYCVILIKIDKVTAETNFKLAQE